MIGKVYKKESKSSDIINGIIEQYKASTSTISANSFVEFVNSRNVGPATGINTTTYTGDYMRRATKIDDNRVLISHTYDSSNHYLYAFVCKINGTTITSGTDTELLTGSSYKGSGNYTVPILIDDDKVLILHQNNNSQHYCYGMVCSISDTTITKQTDTRIGTASMSTYESDISGALLEKNKVFVTCGTTVYGTVITINNYTLSSGTTTSIQTDSYNRYSATTLIDTNRVFIAYQKGSYYQLSRMVCNISGTTISKTVGTDTVPSIRTDAGFCKLAKIDTNKVVLAYNITNSQTIGSVIYTLSSNTLTAGTVYQINNYGWSSDGNGIEVADVSKDEILFMYQKESGGSDQECAFYSVNGSTMTKTDAITLAYSAGYKKSGNLWMENLTPTKIFMHYETYTPSYSIAGAIIDLTPTIKLSTSKIDGITKEEITTSTAGDVWVLNQ